jgi:hypothetical protein
VEKGIIEHFIHVVLSVFLYRDRRLARQCAVGTRLVNHARTYIENGKSSPPLEWLEAVKPSR